MKILCQSKLFYESISDAEARAKFKKKYFSGGKNFYNMPLIQVVLYDAKTRHQLGAIWRDWTVVSKLMFTDPNTVYYWCIKAPCLSDCWVIESQYGKNSDKKSWSFITLSGFTKDHIIETNFIPRYRDFLQQKVNEEYGEYIPIEWSKKENIIDTSPD